MLQLKNITKVYNKGARAVLALDNINISFEEKGLVFIVGKSGSGKSTLLNIMGGLDKMTKGEVVIDSKSTKRFKAKDFDSFRNFYVGFIFQEFNLIDEISVYDNIAISLKIQSKKHDINTIDDALKMVGLENLGYRKPTELSGGQRQRISVARALVKNPKIILADEPTGSLDSNTGEELIATLKDLSKEKLVIVVSHDLDLAKKYADRIIHLSDGKIKGDFLRSTSDDYLSIEMIDKKVLKIKANQIIEDISLINKHLEKGKINYICINKSIERVVLAYPSTFEKLYENDELNNRFYENDKKYIEPSQPKKQKLPKTGIKIKETLKMAIDSFKRKKIRFALMTLFSIIGIALLFTSYNLSSIDRSQILENTISGDSSIVQLAKQDNNVYWQSYDIFNQSDYEFLEENYQSTTFARKYQLNIPFINGKGNIFNSFYLASFSGLVESSNLGNLSLVYLSGDGNFKNLNSIVISDYAAFSINRLGFIGLNEDDNFSLIERENYLDIVGTKLLLQDGEYYEIIGIFDTNFEKYLSLISDNKDFDLYNEFINKKSLYFDYLFVKDGFYEEIALNLPQQQVSNYFLNFHMKENNNEYYYPYSINTIMQIEQINPQSIIYGDLSTPLSDNEIIVPANIIRFLLNDYQIEIDETAIQQLFQQRGNTVSASISGDMNKLGQEKEYIIRSVISDDSLSEIILSQESIDEIEELGSPIYYLIFDAATMNDLQQEVNFLKENNYTILMSNNDFTTSFESFISSFSIIFSVIGGIFALFAFLVILMFMSSSVKLRKKEIGILRASGAKRKDINLIFFSEIGLIVIIVGFGASILLHYINILMNSLITSIFTNIIVFSFGLIDIIGVFALTLAFYFISSFIPLIGVLYKSPISTINRE